MNAPIRRRLVDDGFFEALKALLSFPIGFAELPTDASTGAALVDFEDDTRIYAVVNPVDRAGAAIGPPAAEEADGTVEYDVRVCVGLGRGQAGAQWGADEVVRVLFTREDWGSPVNVISIEKHEEIDRSLPGGFPAATLLDGEWQTTATVQLTVTRSS